MKKIVFYIALIFFGLSITKVTAGEDLVNNYYSYTYQKSIIFVENGISFSVYPDGEFDFYINNRVNVGAGINVGYTSVTFNSGFNYNPYVQYDDYGAIIQVENVPVYYDYYGRVSQIGDVNIWYRNGRVRRVGGLRVFYNNYGYFDHFTGYINVYNRFYVYRPFHGYFIRPAVGFCQVYTRPYRRYYYPVRYTYYSPYYHNYRRAYATVGRPYHYYDRGYRRSKIYRNDRRVAVRDRGHRNEYGHYSRSRTIARNDANNNARTVRRSTTTRSSEVNRTSLDRTRVARSTDNGRRTVSRTVASRERQIRSTDMRRSDKSKNVKSNTRSIKKEYNTSSPRGRSANRVATSSGNRNVKRNTKSTYNKKVKSPSRVTSKPATRSSRGTELAKRTSVKRKNENSNTRSSRGSSKNTVKRSNSRRVR